MHPSEHPDYPEHFQPTALKVGMTPKAAREILDYLELQETVKDNKSLFSGPASNLHAGASFVLEALGITRNFVKWTAEIQ